MANSNITKITLNDPIKRGETEIKEIVLTEPRAGNLRGIKLMSLIEIDAAAYGELVPRIGAPSLTRDEFDSLSLSDLTQFVTVVGGYFEGKNSAQA